MTDLPEYIYLDVKNYIDYLTGIQEDDIALRAANEAKLGGKTEVRSYALEKAIDNLRAEMRIVKGHEDADVPNLKDHIQNMQRAIRIGTEIICKMVHDDAEANTFFVRRVVETLKDRLWNEILIPNATIEFYLAMLEAVYAEWRRMTCTTSYYEYDVSDITSIAPTMANVKRQMKKIYAAGVDFDSSYDLYRHDIHQCSFNTIKKMCDDIVRVKIALRDAKNQHEKWYDALM